MKVITSPKSFPLEPEDNSRLASLCGEHGDNLKLIEERLKVVISNRGNLFYVDGRAKQVQQTEQILTSLYRETEQKSSLTKEDIHLSITRSSGFDGDNESSGMTMKAGKISIRSMNRHQRIYIESIMKFDISFGVGPAGTGKTFLAVACAVQALSQGDVERIVLVRPAVEAGESLGFLPGDIGQKVDPYVRPLYDALYDMLGFDRVGKLVERGVIELAPLAYMRGRTLNDAFIILDEAQNTTREQMKMFLTRIGFGSTAVITGDPSQIDLPSRRSSGLIHAINILSEINDISFTRFKSHDVVRHHLVQRIVEAYEASNQDGEG